MAEKSAKVAAVLDAWGLADLFTQDIEDAPQAPHDNPEPKPDAPKQQPRGSRVTSQEIKQLAERWKSAKHPDDRTISLWAAFVTESAGKPFNADMIVKPENWTKNDLSMVDHALKERCGV